MFPILYEKTVTTPADNGFGFLSDCVECKISETLNGEYKLDMIYPLDGLHAENIKEGRLLYAQRDNAGRKQLFRISDIEVDYITREISVYAPHVSYDLNNYPAPTINTASGGSYADISDKEVNYPFMPPFVRDVIDALRESDFFGLSMPFTFSNSGGFTVPSGTITPADYDYWGAEELEPYIPLRDYLTTANQSVPSVYTHNTKVEMEFDNFTVKFWDERGTDTDISVKYGKNITSLESSEERTNYAYAVVPYASIDNGGVTQNFIGHLTGGADYSALDPLRRKVEIADVSGEGITASNYVSKLAALATEWNEKNDAERVLNSGVVIDFKYLDLAKAGEYWNGPAPEEMATNIGDLITVYFGSTSQKSEIVSIVYDCLKERYDTIAAGHLRPTLSKTIMNIARGG